MHVIDLFEKQKIDEASLKNPKDMWCIPLYSLHYTPDSGINKLRALKKILCYEVCCILF